MHKCSHAHAYTCTCIHMHTCARTCIHTCSHIHQHMHTYLYTHTYINIYDTCMHMHVHMHIHVHVRMHACTQTLFLCLSPTPPAHTMPARPPRGPETVTATITSSASPPPILPFNFWQSLQFPPRSVRLRGHKWLKQGIWEPQDHQPCYPLAM